VSTLPVIGWWPEFNIHTPLMQIEVLLVAPDVAILPVITMTIT
jgi:hypothetical protein